jgi:glycosyltransferase involved in cell wall biosynthesis
VGYVGNLGDRVDWPLVGAVADRMPAVTFHFVGFADGPADAAAMTDWQRARKAAFERPNVVHAGGVPQAEVAAHYWRYAVNWMPYDIAHPFNLAACPTKIMDAIASGRPFVATPTPEVALYPDLIATAADAEGLAAALRRALDEPVDAAARVDFARGHVWAERARQLRAMLGLADGA